MQDIEEGTPLQSQPTKRRKANTSDEQSLLSRLTKCCCSVFVSLVLLALINSISVAGIIIGSYYLDKSFCPAQPNLAPTLIAAGALAIILSVFEGRSRVRAESGDDEHTVGFCLLNLIRLAKFCLFIYLCVLVFSLKSHVTTDEKALEVTTGTAAISGPTVHYCQSTLWFFSFWTVLLVFIIAGAALFTACCVCCMAAIFGDWDD